MSCEKILITDFVQFNPKRTIHKDIIAPFIDMSALPTTNRDIEKIDKKDFRSGGAKFSNGDTLFARITPCLENGKTAKVSNLPKNVNGFGSTEFIVMAAKEPFYDEDFVYYIARLPEFRIYAKARMEGTSGRQRVSWQALAEFKYVFPNKVTRKAIGEFLRKIDDKIQLNTQTNQTLEAIAQALFKSWFVDFDPVKAKMRGEKPVGVDDATAALFPDTLVESELGLIPEGWKASKINDFGTVICGKTPSKANVDFYRGNIPFIKIPDTHGKIFITETTDTLTQAGDMSQPKKRIPKNSVCVSCIATVGQVFITTTLSHTNQQINSVIPHNANSLFYLLFTCKNLNKHFHDLASGGSATLNMNTRTFSNIEIIKPSTDILKAFQESIDGMMKKILANQLESAKLHQLRDTLLPKLLSGEISLDSLTEEA